MPGIMFQDVVCPRERANRKWYTLPLSFLVHTSVIAVLVVAPLIATDVLPKPRSVMEFVTPFVPVVPAPPPVRRDVPRPVGPSHVGPPVVAADTIGTESGLIFQPNDVDTRGIENVIGGFDLGPATVDVLPSPVIAQDPPVPVGGHIKAPTRIKYVAPVYPDIAQRVRVQGVVMIEAVIGVDGRVDQARILRSQPLLDEAALTAVRAWEYTPTLLNGRPTAVIMTVTVMFSLK